MSNNPEYHAKRKEAGRQKAKRAYRLYKRGHSLLAIANMVGMEAGSVAAKVAMGQRLIEAGI